MMRCGFSETYDGQACRHMVSEYSDQCASGHPIRSRAHTFHIHPSSNPILKNAFNDLSSDGEPVDISNLELISKYLHVLKGRRAGALEANLGFENSASIELAASIVIAYETYEDLAALENLS